MNGAYFVYQLLDPMVILCINFWGPTILSSVVALTFYCPTSSRKRFLPTLVTFWFFESSQPNGCGVSCGLALSFPDGECCAASFTCLLPTRVSLERCLFKLFSILHSVGCCAPAPHSLQHILPNITQDIFSLWPHPLPQTKFPSDCRSPRGAAAPTLHETICAEETWELFFVLLRWPMSAFKLY